VTTVSRGDVVRVTFPPADETPDAEFEDPHPAVVLQNDSENSSIDSTVVIPVTSRNDQTPHQLLEVLLTPERDGVENESIAKLTQITTVSIPGRIMDEGEDEAAWKMGEVSPETMEDLSNKLCYLLRL